MVKWINLLCLYKYLNRNEVETCYSYALHGVPWKNVIHTHFTEYHRKMLLICTSQSTKEKCYWYALHRVPWKNVIHMHFTQYQRKMLFIRTSQSTMEKCYSYALHRVPRKNVIHTHFTEYQVIRECSFVFKLRQLWRNHPQLKYYHLLGCDSINSGGQVLTYQSSFYCE
jgi:hypothetical protein